MVFFSFDLHGIDRDVKNGRQKLTSNIYLIDYSGLRFVRKILDNVQSSIRSGFEIDYDIAYFVLYVGHDTICCDLALVLKLLVDIDGCSICSRVSFKPLKNARLQSHAVNIEKVVILFIPF